MTSVYIHIPFCNNICSYCDFCKILYNKYWADKYLDALTNEINDIYNKIIDKLPRIAKSTIYRNIDQLTSLNLIEKFHFDENEIFYLYKGNDQEHSHFIVCHECKKFYTLPSCPIRELEDSIEAEGFIIKDHKFQISGICKNCSLNHLAN